MEQAMSSRELPTRFEDETVIVTGSTRGIGFGIARRFAKEGASVVLNDEGTGDGDDAVSRIEDIGGEAVYVKADLENPDAPAHLVDSVVDEFGSINVVVNNAATWTETTSKEVSIEEWDKVLNTDLRGPWLVSKHASEHMPQGSSIINIGSIHSEMTQVGLFPYNAAKSGINGMTRAMALELAPDIRVNCIDPGWIGVERVHDAITEEYHEHLKSIHPAGRIGVDEDIAGTAAFLASDDASFIIGETINVGGGRNAAFQDDLLKDYSDES